VELAEQETMRTTRSVKAKRAAALAALVAVTAGAPSAVRAQSEEKRPVKHLVTPVMPELGKKLNLSGTVRIEVVIAADGTVKRTRVVGGHPVLAAEAEHAALKSTFESASHETIETIDFKF
jgi:outer membrane biosynthesis protein TonB